MSGTALATAFARCHFRYASQPVATRTGDGDGGLSAPLQGPERPIAQGLSLEFDS
jgi:hypothetical protein